MNEPKWIAKAYLFNYDFFSLKAVSEAYSSKLVSILGFSFNYKYEQGYVYYDQNNLDKHEEQLRKDIKLVKKQISFIKKQIKDLIKSSKKYGRKEDLESLDSWYNSYLEFLPVLGLVLGLEQYLERKVKNFLSEDEFHNISFSKETETAKEQLSILNISLLPYNSEQFREAIKIHLKEYSWIGNKMMNYSPITRDVLINRAIEARKDAQARLSEIKSTRERMEKEGVETILKLNKEEKSLVALYQEILYLRTARAEAICQSASLVQPLFSWLSDQLGFSRHELLRFSKQEIIEMIKSGQKPSPDSRAMYHASIINGQFNVFWGSWGSLKEKIENLSEIKGVIASKGKIKGKVKIIRDYTDFQKFNKGDILVAPYTNPNFLPLIEKASAIITNIGDLTSHAAIISRELNKPCIIDTKISTQVLKDGDEVEVDANSGTIRIIKQQSL